MSVEHIKLQKRYGKEKGIKVGETFGLISGWFFFLFWIGIWISPQPKFTVPIIQNLSILIPVMNFSILLIHLIISVTFIILGAMLAIKGLKKTTLKVAETHRAEKIVTSGIYSVIRHPQYVGGLLAHVGITFLLSACYSLLVSPLMIFLVYLISRKEEAELIKEFSKEYEDYRKKVPMLLPKFKKK